MCTLGHMLKCSLCLDLFEDPVSLASCGHTFCRQCALDTLKQKRECPLDRKPCTGRGAGASLFNPNFTAKAGIDALRVRCRWGLRPGEGFATRSTRSPSGTRKSPSLGTGAKSQC